MDHFVGRALDMLHAPNDKYGRWEPAKGLFQMCGAEWISVGTARRDHPSEVRIHSSADPLMMREYVREKVFTNDPWMRLCGTSTRPSHFDVAANLVHGAQDRPSDLAQLFEAHAINHVVLIPSFTGDYPGGVVLYARGVEEAQWLRSPQGMRQAELSTALFAAMYDPVKDLPSAPPLYWTGPQLSVRERDALSFLASGLRTARIAERMNIEPVTVNKHFASARRKLGARTREQALAMAIVNRQISL